MLAAPIKRVPLPFHSGFTNVSRPRTCRNAKLCASGSKGGEKWEDSANRFIDGVFGTGPSSSSGPPSRRAASAAAPASKATPLGTGTLFLLAANYVIFALDKLVHMSWVPHLYFWGAKASWWQFATSAFCHANFHHLASNMFVLYFFGKTVEDQEGSAAVLSSYLFCAAGACLASRLFAPKVTLLGASGACCGLFTIAALLKLRWGFRSILELAAIAPFVYEQLTSNLASHIGGGAAHISYASHLGGAAAGFILWALLSLLPDDQAVAAK